MEPLSARIPSELYLWLAQLQVEGATTNSDELRILLGQLKRQHDGALDDVAAHARARDLTGRVREALARNEGRTGRHSEVVSLLLDHLTSALALVVSQAPADDRTGPESADPEKETETSDTRKSRVARVIAGSMHALIEPIEDQLPEAMLAQAMRAGDAVIDDLRHELGLVSANRHLSGMLKKAE